MNSPLDESISLANACNTVPEIKLLFHKLCAINMWFAPGALLRPSHNQEEIFF